MEILQHRNIGRNNLNAIKNGIGFHPMFLNIIGAVFLHSRSAIAYHIGTKIPRNVVRGSDEGHSVEYSSERNFLSSQDDG